MAGTKNKRKAADTPSESSKSKRSKTNSEVSDHIPTTTPIPEPEATQPTSPTSGASLPDGSTQTRVTIEIDDSDSDEPAKPKKRKGGHSKMFAHRFKMKDCPQAMPGYTIAADHPELRDSEALVYHWIEFENERIELAEDGAIDSAVLRCSICWRLGHIQKRPWTYTRKGRKTTGNYLNHMKEHHKGEWKKILSEDDAVLNPNASKATGSTLPSMFDKVSTHTL